MRYSEQTLTHEQKAIARKNIGARATGDFVVTFTPSDEEDLEGSPWTADKTFEECKAAYEAGQNLVGMIPGAPMLLRLRNVNFGDLDTIPVGILFYSEAFRSSAGIVVESITLFFDGVGVYFHHARAVSASPVYCTFTETTDGTVSASRDESDIYNAWQNGFRVYATIQFRGYAAFHLVPLTTAEYSPTSKTHYLKFSGVRPTNSDSNHYMPIVVYDGKKWSMQLEGVVNPTQLPTALKNPNALTIKVGDNTVSYDGSSAQEVKVPAADKSLGLTGATVGQIAKIAAVDASGVPTAWEPVNMPSGEEKWEKIAEIELRTDTAEYVLADFATWRKAKVIMTRPQYISGLNKYVWCKVVGSDSGDTYSCGYLLLGYGYVFWQFSAEVNELFIASSHIQTNNRESPDYVKSTGTFMPPASPVETYKFKLMFVDTSVIQAGDKVTVIGVRR